jgi:hypothetical protein
MSYEDDSDCNNRYCATSPIALADVTAKARERRPGQPSATLRTRRAGSGQQPSRHLAMRRTRRRTGVESPVLQRGFDSVRPAWLDNPDFVPVDTSEPDLAGPDNPVLDYTRPEWGMSAE